MAKLRLIMMTNVKPRAALLTAPSEITLMEPGLKASMIVKFCR